jgi:hypothetical protein
LPRPLPVRLINRFGAALQRFGFDPIPLQPELLLKRAQSEAGLHDFGEQNATTPWMADDFRTGLDQLCHSAREDADLNFIGSYALYRQAIQGLITRLQMVDLQRKQPQLFEQTELAPLLVVGMPRSGTTYLHRLLALDPAMQPLPFWKVAHPLPPTGKDNRRRQTQKDLKWIKRMAPELDAKHYLDADEPEECLFLLNPTFKSLAFWVSSPVYGYLEWLKDQDCSAAYQFYRDQLKVLQAQDPSRQLVLKSPVHTGYLDEILTAIPNARIVCTHRDATAVQGSANSLFRTLFSLVSDRVDVPKMAQTNLDLLTTAADRALAARSDLPSDAVLDIRYQDLLQHPVRCVEKIYAHHQLPFTDAFHDALTAYIAARPQHHFGMHRYSLAEFGLDESDVKQRFGRYDQLAAAMD